jgi:hypothetical protein
LSAINHLLAQSLNHLPWVIAGLLFWGVAYWQLYIIKSETFGDVVTLVLSVLPLGIAFVSFNVSAARWSTENSLAWVFLVLGVISLVYAVLLYLRKTKVRNLLDDRGVFKHGLGRNVSLLLKLLIGAISVLASTALLISGGWELIQGAVTTGLILALIGAAIFGLCRWPQWRWNFFESSYFALTEPPAHEAAGQTAVTA